MIDLSDDCVLYIVAPLLGSASADVTVEPLKYRHVRSESHPLYVSN